MAASVRVPMCMGDNMVFHFVDVAAPAGLGAIKDVAGKKFKDFKPKKGHAYHSITGEELTDDIVATMFAGVGGAGVVLSNKEWKGAAKLQEKYAASRTPGSWNGSQESNHVHAQGAAHPAERSVAAPSLPSMSAEPDRACDEALDSAFARAACFLQSADAVFVIAGAGMSVDSGFDTFRSKDGSYTKEDYMAKARHALFEEDPGEAWRWHAPMLEKFRTVPPHSGYVKLLDICCSVGDYFICTSNIDGAFLKAGFPSERLFEAHGSSHMWQCVDAKCNRIHEPWPAANINLDVGLPQCKHCGGLARPNIALFDDGLGRNARTFNTRYIDPQKARFTAWLRRLVARKIVILEFGCGASEHSLRMARKENGTWACMSGEWKIPPISCPLIRVDPGEDEGQADTDFVHIARGAAEVCTSLAERWMPNSHPR